MKKIYLLYTIIAISFTLIFYLYNKKYSLTMNVNYINEVVVFYKYNNEIIGSIEKQKNDPIVDIFNYLTINRNNAPLNYSSIYEYLKLESYSIDQNELTLNISKEYFDLEESDKEIITILLYESYNLLGYDTLIIKNDNRLLEFCKMDIFLLSDYINYEIVSPKGEIIYLYYLQDDILRMKCLVAEFEDAVSYKLDYLFPQIEYVIDNKMIKIIYDNDVDIKNIKESLLYNFQGFDFTFLAI